jgi:hypothetical protein
MSLVHYQNLEEKSNEALEKILERRIDVEYGRIFDYVMLNYMKN